MGHQADLIRDIARCEFKGHLVMSYSRPAQQTYIHLFVATVFEHNDLPTIAFFSWGSKKYDLSRYVMLLKSLRSCYGCAHTGD